MDCLCLLLQRVPRLLRWHKQLRNTGVSPLLLVGRNDTYLGTALDSRGLQFSDVLKSLWPRAEAVSNADVPTRSERD